ncbi:MAG: alpha/beta hydrolase [Planctomycetales bacterium]|nr:alpha/beta hydrolase [Planctomycetales bacterium]
MNGLTSRLLTLSVLSLNLLLPLCADDEAPVTVHRDIEFAEVGGHPLKLDLYLPKVAAKPALVVWIHGGGWRGGSKNKVPIQEITNDGFAIASISYRLTDKATFPAQIHDCKAAVRWLRAHQNQYGYDADWVAVAGSSAGGHLALLMGTSGGVSELEGTVGGNLDQSSTVQAIIDYFGPADFVLRGKTQPERAYTDKSGSFALMGGIEGERLDESTERRASPASYVSADDPPLLIFHGRVDKTVLLDQSEHIAKLYTESGLSAELVILEKAGHGGAAFFRGDPFERARSFLVANRPR